MFIEYYPRKVYGELGDQVIEEKYDVVDFNWHDEKAIQPKWRSLKPPMLDVVKELIENAK